MSSFSYNTSPKSIIGHARPRGISKRTCKSTQKSGGGDLLDSIFGGMESLAAAPTHVQVVDWTAEEDVWGAAVSGQTRGPVYTTHLLRNQCRNPECLAIGQILEGREAFVCEKCGCQLELNGSKVSLEAEKRNHGPDKDGEAGADNSRTSYDVDDEENTLLSYTN